MVEKRIPHQRENGLGRKSALRREFNEKENGVAKRDRKQRESTDMIPSTSPRAEKRHSAKRAHWLL